MLTQGRGVFEAMQTGIGVFTGSTINREIDNADILTSHRAKFSRFFNLFVHCQFACGKQLDSPLVGFALRGIGPHTLLALAVGQHA